MTEDTKLEYIKTELETTKRALESLIGAKRLFVYLWQKKTLMRSLRLIEASRPSDKQMLFKSAISTLYGESTIINTA